MLCHLLLLLLRHLLCHLLLLLCQLLLLSCHLMLLLRHHLWLLLCHLLVLSHLVAQLQGLLDHVFCMTPTASTVSVVK